MMPFLKKILPLLLICCIYYPRLKASNSMEDNNVAQQRYELIQSMRNKILSVPQMNKQQLTELSNEFLHYLDIYSDSTVVIPPSHIIRIQGIQMISAAVT